MPRPANPTGSSPAGVPGGGAPGGAGGGTATRPIRRARRRAPLAAALLALGSLGACSDDGGSSTPRTVPPVEEGSDIEALRVEVVATHPHDAGAFTQGLLVDTDGRLVEGTGLEGRSELRVVDVATGTPSQVAELADDQFGEGVAQVGDRFVQLTWKNGVALVWDAATLEQVGTLPFEGEGWGLCHDAPGTPESRLVRSDGSPTLTFHDPETFEVTGTVDVDIDGQPVEEINELECGDGVAWANVWKTDTILRIDLATGHVTGVVDAAGLLPDQASLGSDAVLNGIAAVPGSDTFYITGKLWPTLFEVRFVPVGAGDPSPSTTP